MDNLQSDLTTIGGGIAQALGDPYQDEDLGVQRSNPRTLDISTEAPSEPSAPLGEYDQLMAEGAALDEYEMTEALATTKAAGGDFREPMFVSDDDTSWEPDDYISPEPPPPPEPEAPMPIDPETLKTQVIDSIKSSENPRRKGMKGDKFFPIESVEGAGGLNKTGQEIGYGVVNSA